MYYRKKPDKVKAVQLIAGNDEAIVAFCIATKFPFVITKEYKTVIRTLYGHHVPVNPGDWIICEINGEFSTCKADEFEATYNPV